MALEEMRLKTDCQKIGVQIAERKTAASLSAHLCEEMLYRWISEGPVGSELRRAFGSEIVGEVSEVTRADGDDEAFRGPAPPQTVGRAGWNEDHGAGLGLLDRVLSGGPPLEVIGAGQLQVKNEVGVLVLRNLARLNEMALEENAVPGLFSGGLFVC